MIYYQDSDIIIRDVCTEDCSYLFQWDIDKELNAHDPRPLPNSTEELLKECKNFCIRFDNEILNENQTLRKYLYFIITNINDQPIGFVNIFSIDKLKKQCELGVVIGDTRFWRRGIAYKSISIVINFIINNMDIKRVYIETGSTNIPAQNLFKKLDFEICGEYLEDNNFKFIIMEYIKDGIAM